MFELADRLQLGIAAIVVVLVIGTLVAIPLLQGGLPDDTPDPLNLQVALYMGEGAWADEETILTHMFEWMGCNLTTVRGDDIRDGCLDNYGILVWPGGHYPAYWDEVGLDGKARIQEFVDGGGGYFGICAGAYYACDYVVWMDDDAFPPPDYKVDGLELNLDLYPGVAWGPIFEIVDRPEPGFAMEQVDIVNHSHPITDNMPDHLSMMYAGGPYLQPHDGANVTILGVYNTTGTPAIVACHYGNGRVFLAGPHGEIEECSDRDGWQFAVPYDEPEDEDSEWPLYYEAVKWLAQIP